MAVYTDRDKQQFIAWISRKAAQAGRPVNPVIYRLSPGDLASRIRIVEMGAPNSLLYGDPVSAPQSQRKTIEDWRRDRGSVPEAPGRAADPPGDQPGSDPPDSPGLPPRSKPSQEDPPRETPQSFEPDPTPSLGDWPEWYFSLPGAGRPGEAGGDLPSLKGFQEPETEDPPEIKPQTQIRKPSMTSRIEFPDRGLKEATSYSRQPPGTTRDAENTRGHDPATGRRRGAQRAGLSKYMPDQVEAAEIQDICHITTSFA